MWCVYSRDLVLIRSIKDRSTNLFTEHWNLLLSQLIPRLLKPQNTLYMNKWKQMQCLTLFLFIDF